MKEATNHKPNIIPMDHHTPRKWYERAKMIISAIPIPTDGGLNLAIESYLPMLIRIMTNTNRDTHTHRAPQNPMKYHKPRNMSTSTTLNLVIERTLAGMARVYATRGASASTPVYPCG